MHYSCRLYAYALLAISGELIHTLTNIRYHLHKKRTKIGNSFILRALQNSVKHNLMRENLWGKEIA